MRNIPVYLSTCLLVYLVAHLSAQTGVPNTSSLTIETIMQGESFVGYLPEDLFWSDDSQSILFDWNPQRDTLRSTFQVSVRSGEIAEVMPNDPILQSRYGHFNKERTVKVFEHYGDIYLLDVKSGQVQALTMTVERESSPHFFKDDTYIVFHKENNLFSWDLSDRSIRQLTDFRSGTKMDGPPEPEYEAWIEHDQLEYFEVLQERKAEREARKRRSELAKPARPTPFYMGSKRIDNIRLSPDMNYVVYRLTKESDATSTEVPNYVTESGQVEMLRSRPKVGFPRDTYETWVYNIRKDTAYQVNTKDLDGIFDKPAFLKDYHKGEEPYQDEYDAPREVLLHGPFFSDDNQAAMVVRSLDNKDRWIVLLDLSNGNLRVIDRQRDEAWIGGPGISGWNFSAGSIGWIDNSRLWFQSEATGYSHLYVADVKKGTKNALTSGEFEILNVQLSKDKSTFYITSNKESPHEHHFYHLPVQGGTLTKITEKPGNHEVSVSPDEQQLAIRYSYSNQPWEVFVMPNEAGTKMRRLTKSTNQAFDQYDWRDPEIIRFKARDGVEVPARLYRPDNPQLNGKAVIFVHGAGYLQNVHKWWSSYYREYMFHNLLVDNGYTVLDIDYRASRGYGRDWRTAIYRHMGGQDLEDQIDGAAYLVNELKIDPNRIGIYGGSYGGFITLMALFQSPGTFKAGAALRSVTDWAHYNHPYTSNILNTPVEDSIAYYRSSPIYHSENLEDHLLILHGMIDQNVQFQDVVRLAQRLVEQGKDNWEFAVFPLERHGFAEPSSWADEYKRIFKLFQEELGKVDR
jgi:dipeptidyl aminopeptidase/acylaminoacyl peptidase